MTKDELGEWLSIFRNAYTEAASPEMGGGPAARAAQVLFACLSKAVFEAIVAKDFEK